MADELTDEEVFAEEPPPPPPPPPQELSDEEVFSQPTTAAPAPKSATQMDSLAIREGQPFAGTPPANAAVANLEAESPILEHAVEGLVETAKGFVPTTVEQVAAFTTPVVDAAHGVMQAGGSLRDILFGGKSINEAVAANYPEAGALSEVEQTPAYSKERFTQGFGILAQLGMGAAIGKSIQPTLRSILFKEKMGDPAPITAAIAEKEVIPDAKPVTEPATAAAPEAQPVPEAVAPVEPVLGKQEPVAPGLPTGTGEVKTITAYRSDDPSQPTVFDINKTRGGAVYFTENPEYADIYTQQFGPNIKPRKFNIEVKNTATAEDLKNLRIATHLRRGTVSHITHEEVAALKAKGFDSIRGRSSEHGGTDIAVFNPENIKLSQATHETEPKISQEGTKAEQSEVGAITQREQGLEVSDLRNTEPSRPVLVQEVAQKPSKIGQSIEAKAVEAKLTQGFPETAGYKPIEIKEQANMATSFIKDNPIEARAVVTGDAPLPKDLKGTSLITAMEEELLRKPDAQLAYELANSPLIRATSEAAQELRLMRERVPDSLTAKFNEILEARRAGSQKRGDTPQRLAKEINQEVVKQSSKRPTWEAFVREITCA